MCHDFLLSRPQKLNVGGDNYPDSGGLLGIVFWLPILTWLFGAVPSATDLVALHTESGFPRILLQTVAVALVTAIGSTALAYPLAILWWRVPSWRGLCEAIVFLPLMVGLLARNYGWIGMLSGQDVLSSMGFILLGAPMILYTKISVFVVMAYIFTPISFFFLRNAFSSVPDNAVWAARVMGATELTIIMRVGIVFTRRHAAISGMFIFSNAVAYFITPRILSGNTFDMVGNLVYRYAVELGDFKTASLISVAMILWLIPFYWFTVRFIVNHRRQMIGR